MREILTHRRMLLPAIVPETGPFAGMTMRWIGDEPPVGTGQRSAAVGFYLALVTAHCLDLIGHVGPVIVEGPFARNKPYLTMLEAVTASSVIPTASTTGTSEGAALLVVAQGSQEREIPARPIREDPLKGLCIGYASEWNAAVKAI